MNKQTRSPKLLKDANEDKMFKKRFALQTALSSVSSKDRKAIVRS